jgi:hypothetical protein
MIAPRLNVKCLDEWYERTLTDVLDQPGGIFLARFLRFTKLELTLSRVLTNVWRLR